MSEPAIEPNDPDVGDDATTDVPTDGSSDGTDDTPDEAQGPQQTVTADLSGDPIGAEL